ncbi:MAG TPA: hypothetical protein VF315_05870 [Steroidobacteraceae bacterium]
MLAQLTLDNTNNELLPGAYAEVHFELPAGAAGTSFKLPANVLLFRRGALYVATVDAHHRVLMKPVTIGRDYGSEVEVIDGLAHDDEVILSPPDALTDGAAIRVVKSAAGRVAQS